MKDLVLCDDTVELTISHFVLTNSLGIEIQTFRDPSLFFNRQNIIKSYRSKLNGVKIRSIHGPGFGPSPEICIGSINPEYRRKTRTNFDIAVQLAIELDCSHIILHHGFVPGQICETDWFINATMFLGYFIDSVPQSISVHIENGQESDPYLLFKVISSVNRPNLDICLDIGHVYCHSTIPIIEWIEFLGERIGYVHLHDNNGLEDQHLALGEGNIPLINSCRSLLKYSPNALWAIESNVPEIPKSIDWLRKQRFF